MEKLTVAQRNIITEAAKLSQRFERDEVRRMNAQAKELIISEGNTLIEELTSDEKRQWAAKVSHLHKNSEHADILKMIKDMA